MNRFFCSAIFFTSLFAQACGGESQTPARFGIVSVGVDAPSATISGKTHGLADARRFGPECEGFVDPSIAEHQLQTRGQGRVRVEAWSDEGPLVLALRASSGSNSSACNSDDKSGHRPHLEVESDRDYQVYVGTLRDERNQNSHGELHYSLRLTFLAANAAPNAGSPSQANGERARSRVAIAIATIPAGATIFGPEGNALGQSPLVTYVPSDVNEVIYRAELAGYRSETVTARPTGERIFVNFSLTADGSAQNTSAQNTNPPSRTSPAPETNPRERISHGRPNNGSGSANTGNALVDPSGGNGSASMIICPDGRAVRTAALCSPTRRCPDGSSVPSSQSCPTRVPTATPQPGHRTNGAARRPNADTTMPEPFRSGVTQ